MNNFSNINMNSLNNWTKASTQAKKIYDCPLYGRQEQLVPINCLNHFRTVVPTGATCLKTTGRLSHRQILPRRAGYIYNSKKIFSSFRSVITDQARRGRYEQKELETVTIKTILKGQQLHNNYNACRAPRLSQYQLKRSFALKAFVKPRGTVTRVRNRCVITGRSSITGSTGLSRICFRQRAGLGKIPGLLKI
jgi:ribosomal protein S14